ncbi:RNA polymerase sigma-70 factor [Microbacterium suaedae]|uniref:RNA polymerase sigma-70 factor n=1 Tax=Microbacterium suaedae TaxID=2067813 RepID=UPI000DA145AB|nr:RNA polymerase sigma-70 factor [Microbacterium suaedae]
MSGDAFTDHRRLLFTIAYEILGSVSDAEDVVQESWIRWNDADRGSVRDARAYLARIATRQALNRVRAVSRRREEYVGPWLPEPLLTTGDVAEDAVLSESVSTAMMLVLETLGPVERAVFVLREVFDFGYDEIAEAVDRAPATVRQIAHRAREHVRARRPRVEVGSSEAAAVLELFRRASTTGDVGSLMEVLAPGVVLIADGGGRVTASRRPIHGAEKVLRFIVGLIEKNPGTTLVVDEINGRAGIRVLLDGEPDGAVTVDVAGGRITAIYYVRNPDKLARLGGPVRLER